MIRLAGLQKSTPPLLKLSACFLKGILDWRFSLSRGLDGIVVVGPVVWRISGKARAQGVNRGGNDEGEAERSARDPPILDAVYGSPSTKRSEILQILSI